MREYVIKLSDIGEGVAEAELVEWHAELGQMVREDDVLASVMTDKATVEIPSDKNGKVVWLGGKAGETLAVGAPLIRLEIEGSDDTGSEAADDLPKTPQTSTAQTSGAETVSPPAQPGSGEVAPRQTVGPGQVPAKPGPAPLPPVTARTGHHRAEGAGVRASPSVRRRALDNGVDLRRVPGTGPAGRVTHEDLDLYFRQDSQPDVPKASMPNLAVEEVRIIGYRRQIAEKMSLAKRRIPHITYVEEIDIGALETLRGKLNADRAKLNAQKDDNQPKLTILPFLMMAMVRAIARQPQMNARYDDEAGIVKTYGGVHIGIAAQTDRGLLVPVVRHAETLSLNACADEVARLADIAKSGKATREELTNSTITITSLGAMGGLVTTPVINYPEVAIIGVNKMQIKPVWDGGQFVPRKMMNLSSSFDHRVIDGYDAAVFVQTIKSFLEEPATLFIEAQS